MPAFYGSTNLFVGKFIELNLVILASALKKVLLLLHAGLRVAANNIPLLNRRLL